MRHPVLRAVGLVRRHGVGASAVHALAGVDLAFYPGTFTAIVGPSGSGKTTLLQLLGGLDRPTHGSVEVAGTTLSGLSHDEVAAVRARHIGFVFQDYSLIRTLTAIENVTLPLELAGSTFARARPAAQRQLHRFGLADRCDHFPEALSGGEQQRVALARASVADQSVLLADEPTGALDTENGVLVLAHFRRQADAGTYCVVATHNPDVAAAADRVVTMRDGRVVQDAGEAP
jgi:putative ABC transport system ATP-binding protein